MYPPFRNVLYKLDNSNIRTSNHCRYAALPFLFLITRVCCTHFWSTSTNHGCSWHLHTESHLSYSNSSWYHAFVLIVIWFRLRLEAHLIWWFWSFGTLWIFIVGRGKQYYNTLRIKGEESLMGKMEGKKEDRHFEVAVCVLRVNYVRQPNFWPDWQTFSHYSFILTLKPGLHSEIRWENSQSMFGCPLNPAAHWALKRRASESYTWSLITDRRF